MKKYGKYKDSGIAWIGEIPEEWGLMRLQFCLKEIKEQNNPIKSKQVLSLVKDKGVMLYEEKGNLGNVAKEDISEYKLAYPNTLILNSMNILIGSVGISKYFGCVSPVYYVFKETDQSDLRFINYLFTTREFQKQLRRYANGIMEIRLRVSAEDIFKRKIALPTKQEQQAIADYLDKKCAAIDKTIETEEKVIEKLKEYKQSLITETVTKGLDKSVPMKDSGIEWMPKIPAHWAITKLSRIATTCSGATPLRDKEDSYFSNANIRWIRTLDLNNSEVYDSSEKITEFALSNTSCSIMPINTLMVAMYGGAGTIGKCGLLKAESTTNQAICSIVLKDKNPKYYLYVLLTIRTYWMKYANGTRKDPNISQDIVNDIIIPIPPITEQQAIADYLDNKCAEIDKAIADKEQVIEKLTEYKKSLIYECVTGKRRVA